MFISFDTIHERDGHTDRHTDTAWRHRPRLCIASRGKNRLILKKFGESGDRTRELISLKFR